MTMKNLNESKLKIFQEIGNKISVIRKKKTEKKLQVPQES